MNSSCITLLVFASHQGYAHRAQKQWEGGVDEYPYKRCRIFSYCGKCVIVEVKKVPKKHDTDD